MTNARRAASLSRVSTAHGPLVRVLKSLAIALLVFALAAAAAIYLAPVERLRQPIEAAVRQATGRAFHIHGPIQITLSAGIAIDLGAVTLADAPGGDSAAMVAATRAILDIEFLPLLSGDTRPTGIVRGGAEIRLPHDAAGGPTGRLGAAADPLAAIPFGDLRLIRSRVVVSGPDGVDGEIDFVDARLRWPEDAAVLNLSGEVAFRSERFDVEALIEQPATLFAGGAVPLRLVFRSSLAEGELDGAADLARSSFDGGITISAPSARRLATFFGGVVPGDRGFGPMSFAASVRATPGEVHVRDAKFSLDDTIGGGDFGIRLTGTRLSFAGALSVDSFDLDSYLTPLPPLEGERWSDAPLDLSGLAGFDASLGIRARNARLAGLALANANATLEIVGGEAALNIGSASLYAGFGRARLTAGVNGPAPHFTLALSLTDIDAQSFFADALATKALGGRAALTADLAATGATRREIVSGLGGAVRLELAGGALGGVDLGAVARSIAGPGEPEGTAADDGTTVAALTAAFSVKDGMATLDETILAGPSRAWTVRGTFGLAARALRLRIAPAPGTAFSMPFTAAGSWAAPVYRPDYQELAAMIARGEAALADLGELPPERRSWLVVLLRSGTRFPDPPAVPGVVEPAPPAPPAGEALPDGPG